MPYSPHELRVFEEKKQLDDRLGALRSFLYSQLSAGITENQLFAGIAEDERYRLRRQAEVMAEYSRILGERILCFPRPNDPPAPSAPAVLSRAALTVISEAVQAYLAQLENREPPPDQSPVDVIEAASQHVMAQRGIEAPADLREACTQVLQHYLRKEVR